MAAVDMAKPVGYKAEYAKQLTNGLRYDEGLSVIELCRLWRISKEIYESWCNEVPEFNKAHKIGVVDYASHWQEIIKGMALGKIKGNAAVVAIAIANVEGVNWVVRPDQAAIVDDVVNKIVIEMLPGRKQAAKVDNVVAIK